MPGAVQDVITPANFGEDRLRGFGVAMGWILAFPLTCFVAFKTLSHYRATVWYSYAKQNQQLQTNSTPRENELNIMEWGNFEIL